MSRLVGMIRFPFGTPLTSTATSSESDWIPYNGPVEPRTPHHQLRVVGHSIISQSSQSSHDSTPGASSSRMPPTDEGRHAQRTSDTTRPNRIAFALDDGGIGASPAHPPPSEERRHKGRFTFGHTTQTNPSRITPKPPTSTLVPSKSKTLSPPPALHPLPPPRHPIHQPHDDPFRSNRTQVPSNSAISFTSPKIIHSNGNPPIPHLITPMSRPIGEARPRAATMSRYDPPRSPPPTAPLPSEPTASRWRTTRPLVGGRQRSYTDAATPSMAQLVIPEKSEQHFLPEPVLPSPSFSLGSHPFGRSATTRYPNSTKPPIPPKTNNVLRRIRPSASSPNLMAAVPASNASSEPSNGGRARAGSSTGIRRRFHSTVHENPLSLEAESSLSALFSRRPKFKAALTVAENPPSSPYTLLRPKYQTYDSEKAMLNCLPTPMSKDPMLSLSSAPEPKTREELLEQTVREHGLLDAERAKWAMRAKSGFGNERSRNLSMHRPTGPKRSASYTGVRERAMEGAFGTVSTSTGSSSAKGGLSFLAATAFGHGHKAKLSIDNATWSMRSAGGAVARSSSSAGGHGGPVLRRSASHSQTGSRTSSEGVQPRWAQSVARTAFRTVADACAPGDPLASPNPNVPYGARPQPPPPTISLSGPRPVEFMGDEKIGMAFSTPPATPDEGGPLAHGSDPGFMSNHPYAQAVSSPPHHQRMKAGPHPSSPLPIVTTPYPGNIVARHRLPPQAHHRTPSAVSSGGSSDAPLVPASPLTQHRMSSHPFIKAAGADGQPRPSSGLIEASFEDAMMSSTLRTSWMDDEVESQILAGLGISTNAKATAGRGMGGSQDNHRDDLDPAGSRGEGGARMLNDGHMLSIFPDTETESTMTSPGRNTTSPRRARGHLSPAFPLLNSQPLIAPYDDMRATFGVRDNSAQSSAVATPETLDDDIDGFHDLFYRPTVHSSPVFRSSAAPAHDTESGDGRLARPLLEDADARPSGDWLHSPTDMDLGFDGEANQYASKHLSYVSSVESSADG